MTVRPDDSSKLTKGIKMNGQRKGELLIVVRMEPQSDGLVELCIYHTNNPLQILLIHRAKCIDNG